MTRFIKFKQNKKSILSFFIFLSLILLLIIYNPIKMFPQNPSSDKNKKDNRSNKKEKSQVEKYSIEQAVSDNAQLNTISFDGLAFLTGNLGSYTFFPPGKVADYFGFQYMRDIDVIGGHNMNFLTSIANNILYILNDQQKDQLVALGKEQAPLYKEFALKRFLLIKAFRRLLDNDIPAGKKELNKNEVMKYTSELYLIDGKLSYQRAKVVGKIIRELNASQKAYLDKLVFGDSKTWPDIKEEPIDKTKFSHEVHVAVMTYASELFSWYKGSIEADVYFCPERHGTYFGSFYMKDMPAVGNPDYHISTELTGNSGESFLETLTDSQKKLITDLVDIQRDDLNEIVNIRKTISLELRRFMKENAINEENIYTLSKRYGELDGEISYYYATHFTDVAKTLSASQKTVLKKLRNLDNYECPEDTAFIFADKITMPDLANTDFFFK